MSQDSRLQMALAHDAGFLDRVQYSMCRIALQVCAEASTVTGHAARRAFAQSVLGNPAAAATACAVALVGAVNLTAPVTTINPDKTVSSGASDADIDSQVNSLWNSFAGV
jgi:hypothetical protein